MLALLLVLGVSSVYADPQEILPGVKMDFNLTPNKREEFTNFAFQRVHAACVISTEDEEGNDIFVEVLRKSGKINDLPVSTGDNVVVRVRDKDVLRITAEPGGKVALTNMGQHAVKAACST
ncbi:MAG: hypothetical protein NTW08_03525 [Gammaproteobacteria bacterium]|nr:hypothetical protein [Gammaproteobacteria bacterium]